MLRFRYRPQEPRSNQPTARLLPTAQESAPEHAMKQSLIAFLLASTLTLSMAGCSGNDAGANAGDATKGTPDTGAVTDTTPEEPTPPTPEERIAAAALQSSTATSVNALTTMKMQDTSGSMDMDMTVNMSYLSNPAKLKADMNISMGELGSMVATIYGTIEGEACQLYTQVDDTWVAQNADSAEVEQFDTLKNLDLYLSNCFEMKADGSEDLAAGSADKYTGVIKGSALKDVLESSGLTESLETTLPDTEDMEDYTQLFDNLADMPISVWIDQATNYPVKVTLDMKDTVNGIMDAIIDMAAAESDEPINKDELPRFETAQWEMTCSDFNNVPDFEIPAEALAAPVIDA